MHTGKRLGQNADLGQRDLARDRLARLLVDVNTISETHELGAAIVPHSLRRADLNQPDDASSDIGWRHWLNRCRLMQRKKRSLQQLLDRSVGVGDALDRVAQTVGLLDDLLGLPQLFAVRERADVRAYSRQEDQVHATVSTGRGERSRGIGDVVASAGASVGRMDDRRDALEYSTDAAVRVEFDAHMPVGDQVMVDGHYRAGQVANTGNWREVVLH